MVQIWQEVHSEWEEIFRDECERRRLTKTVLKDNLLRLSDLLEKANEPSAYQTLAILILKNGIDLPLKLKNIVLKSLNWDTKRMKKLFPYNHRLRRFYFRDFREKLKNYKPGKSVRLIRLGIFYDKEFDHTCIGLRDFNHRIKTHSLDNITYLNLDSCELKKIPKDILKFKYISKLSLEYNNIRMIPFFITNLEYLKFLNLKGNKIEYLPNFLLDLKNLKRLNIQNNPLKEVSRSLIQSEAKRNFRIYV
ncbi:MAG: hypothetical protein GF311_20825 [Candidatus Lokiarchaeota archaeon]|nr:hypothetical protein [Candidatus Lokiarchaeota archaeon]